MQLIAKLATVAQFELETFDASLCRLLPARVLLCLRGATAMRELDLTQATKSVSPPQVPPLRTTLA